MQVAKQINAPAEAVWNALVDTQQWPHWGPSVKAVECSQRIIAACVEGRVKSILGPWVPFMITRFEPLVYWDWKVAGIPATGHRVKRLGSGRCELIFEMPFVAFPYAVICRQAAERIARLVENDVNS